MADVADIPAGEQPEVVCFDVADGPPGQVVHACMQVPPLKRLKFWLADEALDARLNAQARVVEFVELAKRTGKTEECVTREILLWQMGYRPLRDLPQEWLESMVFKGVAFAVGAEP